MLACQVSRSGTSGILLRGEVVLLLVLLGISVYSRKTKHHIQEKKVRNQNTIVECVNMM
jgi:hypothetical protein